MWCSSPDHYTFPLCSNKNKQTNHVRYSVKCVKNPTTLLLLKKKKKSSFNSLLLFLVKLPVYGHTAHCPYCQALHRINELR